MTTNQLWCCTAFILGVLVWIPAGYADTGGPDAFGYVWQDSNAPAPVEPFAWTEIAPPAGGSGTELTDLTSEDDRCQTAPIGFNFDFYGNTFSEVVVSTNGFLTFYSSGCMEFSNRCIPDGSPPNDMIAVFWDDLDLDNNPPTTPTPGETPQYARVFYDTQGTEPNREFIVEWYNVPHISDASSRLTFQAKFLENNGNPEVKVQFNDMQNGTMEYADGRSATLGIENSDGSIGLEYSCMQWSAGMTPTPGPVYNGLAVRYFTDLVSPTPTPSPPPTVTPTSTATPIPFTEECPPGSVFGNNPDAPDVPWTMMDPSDQSVGIWAADNFIGIMDPIWDIHWWGYEENISTPGVPCIKSVPFEIQFLLDAGGIPGPVLDIRQVEPIRTNTGFIYDQGPTPMELVYYEAHFDTPVIIPGGTGWISIQGTQDFTNPNCWFWWLSSSAGDNLAILWIPDTPDRMWMPMNHDYAFCLTSNAPATPTPTETATPTITPVPTETPTPTPTITPTQPPTITMTPFPTMTPPLTPTQTPPPTATMTPPPTATMTPPPTVTMTPPPTATTTPPPTPTPSPPPTFTPTPVPFTPTPVPTSTPPPTVTMTPVPTMTPPPEPTPTFTSPPVPTHTPAPEPTATATEIPPTPTVTPPCDALGMTVEMPEHFFSPGDEGWVRAQICNPGPTEYLQTPVVIVLDINGFYWFWPTWSNSLDWVNTDVTVGVHDIDVVPTFTWPESPNFLTDAWFYAAMIDSDFSAIIGEFGMWNFGWGI